MIERYDHELIRKFLEENGQNPDKYFDGILEESEIEWFNGKEME